MPVYGTPFNIYFMPAVSDITAITNANPAVVTTQAPHGYLTGGIVRIDIPLNFGMQQINHIKAPIIVLSTTTFSIAIDSTLFDPFSVPSEQPGFNWTPAQATPVGEQTSHLDSSFINILTPLY